jgi:hypothetical protein
MEVEMVNYDPVKDSANVAFISSKGNPMSLWIHRTTFEKLMLGPWDTVQMGDPTIYQRELRDSLKRKVRGGYMQWFEENSNRIMKDNTIVEKAV